jgi:hypothetical protein
MREDVREAIEEACGTAVDDRRVRVDSPKVRGHFLVRLRRFLDNLPPDLTLDELRNELIQ